jgi:hypothetical protein
MTEVDEIKGQLYLLTSKVDTLIAKFEARIPTTEAIEDRIFRLTTTSKTLSDVSFRLAMTKGLMVWGTGAIAGAVAGGVVAWVLFAARFAGAH